MNKNRLALGFLLVSCAAAAAQNPGPHLSGHGELSVTATVVSSVGVEMGRDGQPRIVVANALDPKDNVSSLQVVREVRIMPVKTDTKPAKERKNLPSKSLPGAQD